MMAVAGWGSGEGGGLCAEMGPRKEGNVVLAVAAVCVCDQRVSAKEGGPVFVPIQNKKNIRGESGGEGRGAAFAPKW